MLDCSSPCVGNDPTFCLLLWQSQRNPSQNLLFKTIQRPHARVATERTEGCSGNFIHPQIERQAQPKPQSTSALEQGAVSRLPMRKQGKIKALVGLLRLQERRGDLGVLGRDSHKEA